MKRVTSVVGKSDTSMELATMNAEDFLNDLISEGITNFIDFKTQAIINTPSGVTEYKFYFIITVIYDDNSSNDPSEQVS